MKRRTIWLARDRRGEDYFSARPSFVAMHDIFVGPHTTLPRDRKRYRLVKRFKANVIGPGSAYGYPRVIACGLERC